MPHGGVRVTLRWGAVAAGWVLLLLGGCAPGPAATAAGGRNAAPHPAAPARTVHVVAAGAAAIPLPRPRAAPVWATPLATVTALAAEPGAAETLPAPGGQTAAVVSAAGLRVGGRTVAARTGAVVWSPDGRVLFFTDAPPAGAPTTPERLFAAGGNGGAPIPLGVTSDPWRLSATGAESVAFDDGGVLAIANAMGPTVVRTDIALPMASARQANPFGDSAFSVSANLRYAAVLTPQNHVAIYTLARGAVPAAGVLRALGTAAPGAVPHQDLPPGP